MIRSGVPIQGCFWETTNNLLMQLVKIVILFGLFGIAACSTPDPAIPSSVGISDTAKNIVGLYESNEVAAKNKYTDKWADISGEISGIEEKSGLFEVSLRGEDFSFSELVCKLPSDNLDAVTDLRSGDNIEVRGLILGVTGMTNVVVKPCTIIFPVSATNQINTPATQTPSELVQGAQSATSQQVIINDPKELNFNINDFPVGWQMGTQQESGVGYEVRVLKLGSVIAVPEKIVSSWVGVFPDSDSAKEDYEVRRKRHADRFRLNDPEIGDKSYIYEGNATDEVIFRVNNVVAQVTMFTQYGGSLKDVERWANQLADKIARFQLLGDPVEKIPPAASSSTTIPLTPTGSIPKPTSSPSMAVPLTIPPQPTIRPSRPRSSPSDASSGRIAFMSDRDGNWEIYLMDYDGTNQTRLTNNESRDFGPVWSPSGDLIIFSGSTDNADAIYLIPIRDSTGNGSAYKIADGSNPVWSPDGSSIAFVVEEDRNQEIYVMRSDGSDQVRLTNNPGYDLQPIWSPDGTKIAFTSRRNDQQDVYVMNANGSAQTKLTDSPTLDEKPAWSPDGSMIAFASNREDNSWEIFVMDTKGGHQTRLTKDINGSSSNPTWSPDSRTIAFSSDRDGDGEIYTVNISNLNEVNLTQDDSGGDSSPSWSGDGQSIVFTKNIDRRGQIFTMNSDGSGVLRLTNNAALDWFPAWSPN